MIIGYDPGWVPGDDDPPYDVQDSLNDFKESRSMIPAHPHKIPARPVSQGWLFAFLKYLLERWFK